MTEPEHVEALVRAALAREADRVPLPNPEWDPARALRATARRVAGQPVVPPSVGPSRRWLAHVAVAALAVLTLVGVVVAGRDGPEEVPTARGEDHPGDVGGPFGGTTMGPEGTGALESDASTTTMLGPPVTLPPLPGGGRGTPVTVPDLPPTYYRLAPDLEVGWVDTGGDPRVCWRTVVVEECTPEAVGGDGLVVPIAGSAWHTVVLVVPEPGAPQPGTVVVVVAGRGEVTAVVEWDEEVHAGVARVSAPIEQVDVVGR